MKKFRYFLEACLLWLAFSVFRCLSAPTASDFGGWIGRSIGPRLAASRKAMKNLKNALPDKTDVQHAEILIGMWDNLGRVFAEYPHLETIVKNHTQIVGHEHIATIGADNACVMIGGHFANWEIIPYHFNHNSEWPIAAVYRTPNNPYAEKLLDKCRGKSGNGLLIPKSTGGTRAMLKAVREGRRIAIFIDQKYNEGIPVPFLGHPAMTSTAFAQLGRKYDCPIIPVQVERLKGCDFRMTIHPSFKVNGMSEEETVIKAHQLFEGWVRQNPEQWLWLHRRWNSKSLEHRF